MKNNSELNEEFVCFHNMNYSYFIESAIYRIYAVYDKLANLLCIYTNTQEEQNTFERFMRHIANVPKNSDLIEIARSIFNTEEYKELAKLRQDNYHYMTKENFINIRDSEWSNVYNLISASKNIELLKNIISKIMKLFSENPIQPK